MQVMAALEGAFLIDSRTHISTIFLALRMIYGREAAINGARGHWLFLQHLVHIDPQPMHIRALNQNKLSFIRTKTSRCCYHCRFSYLSNRKRILFSKGKTVSVSTDVFPAQEVCRSRLLNDTTTRESVSAREPLYCTRAHTHTEIPSRRTLIIVSLPPRTYFCSPIQLGGQSRGHQHWFGAAETNI